MITIEVDCNDDAIRIIEDGSQILRMPVESTYKYLNFFSELFNRISPRMDESLAVELIWIDEDNRKTVEEW